MAYKPLRSTRHITVLKNNDMVNSLGHVLFPFARWQHDHTQTPLPCETSMTRAWAVATTARRPWAGLTVSIWTSMRLAPVRCRVLLHSLLPTDDACSSSSLSTTVIKFSIFPDPTRKLSALPPELRIEYGNSKTTLLHSAKCTRPLFQGRNHCGGRPSGWHDIVTCQRLVLL